jgi:8-oxo-dGTP pyrophosphatase MutT (NUDIX family)
MSRAPIPTSFFALVVVRKGSQFLLVQEQRYGNCWAIPGGRVEPGETFIQAAVREVLEEAGIAVRLEGVVRIEHTPSPSSARIRVIFVGTPTDETMPKSIADEESVQAKWLTVEQATALPMRGADLLGFLQQVSDGAIVQSLDTLGTELSM